MARYHQKTSTISQVFRLRGVAGGGATTVNVFLSFLCCKVTRNNLSPLPVYFHILFTDMPSFKGRFGKGPKGPDFDAIELQASRSATVVDSVEAMIPEEDWSDHLRK